jgi:hypothetical protein
MEVQRHTDETRAEFAKPSGLLGPIQPTRLTHFVKCVELPADVPIMLRLTSAKRPAGANMDTLAIAAIHVPSESRTTALKDRWKREADAGLPMKPYPNYVLDIYQPDGTFLVQTKGVTAGKMVVSLWRDVYTLNYEQISGPKGPEPSVSKWIPPAPKT